MNSPVVAALLAKIEEQIERLDHLTGLLPEDGGGAAPLLGHLLDCLAGFCAVLYKVDPARLAHFARLRDLPVNHRCDRDEARGRIAEYRAHIAEGFACLDDAALALRLPTVFVAEGEAVITLLLGNLEHLINHKYQLFAYLKTSGVRVGTSDLYRLRG
jgi:hypothetical protein